MNTWDHQSQTIQGAGDPEAGSTLRVVFLVLLWLQECMLYRGGQSEIVLTPVAEIQSPTKGKEDARGKEMQRFLNA